MSKNLKKKWKKFKKKSSIPRWIYLLGLATKSFFRFATGLSLIFIAVLSVKKVISGEELLIFLLNSWPGKIFLFLLGASLIIYQIIELLSKTSEVDKIIKKV